MFNRMLWPRLVRFCGVGDEELDFLLAVMLYVI
jgi:hypothetical protein